MRYEGTRPSGQDKDISVYIFTMGKREIEILHSIAEKALIHMPRTLETITTESRLRNITKGLKQALND